MDDVLTVVVVDENENVCHGLARSLDRLPDIRVLAHATNLMLAAELAHQFAPDVILADFKWGEAKRPDILQWLGRMSPQSALVVYSSYYRDGEREAFKEARADLCLLKGISVKELGTQIRGVGTPRECAYPSDPAGRSCPRSRAYK